MVGLVSLGHDCCGRGIISVAFATDRGREGKHRQRGLPPCPLRDGAPSPSCSRCGERGASTPSRRGRRLLYLTPHQPRARIGEREGETLAMKPRPSGIRAAAAAAAAAGEGLVGGRRRVFGEITITASPRWRPRPRPAAAAAMSARGSGTHAVAVHSEEHHRGVHGLRFPPQLGMGMGMKQFAAELEARIEKVIYACRFMTFLAIVGSLVGSVPCFLKGCVYVMDAFIEYYLHGGGKVILMLVEAIDMFLVGTVMFVFGTGLYELFISNMDIAKSSSYGSNLFGLFRLPERPKWLKIQSVNDLKTKLGHVIVMVLMVGIFEKSKRVTITSCTDLFCFAASIFLSSACLYLLSRLSSK
uniref:Uncharacterized protein n=1 Tax=Leersia perrieri TaxID=77586 RepID=A0A0D9WU10_9ORYZ